MSQLKRCSSRIDIDKSSHRRCSIKGLLKNFAIFAGKHLCWRPQRRCFPVKIAITSRTPILKNMGDACFRISCIYVANTWYGITTSKSM